MQELLMVLRLELGLRRQKHRSNKLNSGGICTLVPDPAGCLFSSRVATVGGEDAGDSAS